MNIAGVEIGQGKPCRFVAELSCNHGGSYQRMLKLIDAAQAATADFVKFQAYRPSELVALRGDGPAPSPWGEQGFTMLSLYERAQTPLEWFPDLAAYCATIGIPWFSSVFGEESLAVLESVGCPVYKVAKFERNSTALLRLIAETGKPFIVSAMKPRCWRGSDAHGKTYWPAATLYCPGEYPCALTDVNLPWFQGAPRAGGKTWSDTRCIGLSSHCLDPLLPIAAVARGCKLIEMHMMLDDEPSELESNVSLTTSQFAEMIRDVRRVERMFAA